MDFENDIIIDDSALDVEWLNQPALAIKYGKYWADCEDNLARAEQALKIVQAELIDKINGDPERWLGEGVKPTVSNIDSCVIQHGDYQEAKEQVLDAQHKVRIAQIAKAEISHTRKTALENLVRLHGQSYFAGPSVPRDLTVEALKKEQAKRADSGVHRKMSRNKK